MWYYDFILLLLIIFLNAITYYPKLDSSSLHYDCINKYTFITDTNTFIKSILNEMIIIIVDSLFYLDWLELILVARIVIIAFRKRLDNVDFISTIVETYHHFYIAKLCRILVILTIAYYLLYYPHLSKKLTIIISTNYQLVINITYSINFLITISINLYYIIYKIDMIE